jgi:hypothetical protein
MFSYDEQSSPDQVIEGVADDLGVGRFAQHNGVVGSNRASAVSSVQVFFRSVQLLG